MNPVAWLNDWRDRRNREWFANWELASRWHELAQFNSNHHNGIVYTPEKIEEMARLQAAFYAETDEERARRHRAARKVGYR